MDDQQPNFKVTDRRLFNVDGSPRDLPAEERTTTGATEPIIGATSPLDVAPGHTEQAVSSRTDKPSSESNSHDDDELTEEELAGVQDPASFVNFVMSIASNAAASLGMMEHPATHEREVDLELGKHWIDVLGMLQKKTKGNLTPQEQKMLDGLLRDLRMQFVSLANATPKSQAFTGKDITGGR